jgi:hypothetical protein
MSVYEIVVALDTTQTKIVELERTINAQKDDITTEFEKVVRIARISTKKK